MPAIMDIAASMLAAFRSGIFGLGDLANVLLADGGNLGLVGHAGAGLDAGGLLDQDGGGSGVLVMKVKERSA